MESQSDIKQEKPFVLVKFFTYSSFFIIFFGIIAISLFSTHFLRKREFQKSEEYARLAIENLNHQIFTWFLLPTYLQYGKIKLSDPKQYQRMDDVVRTTLHGFRVDMVNIYGMTDTIAYSFSKELKGKRNFGGRSYQSAIKGEISTKLVQRGSRWQILFSSPKKVQIITFAPLLGEKQIARSAGPVLGVIEIIQDLTEEYQAIFKFQILTIVTITGVMATLFILMIFVVKRGDEIIQKRALERITLKEELSRAKHLSSLGEMIAGVSHEIRNPLGIIRSSAEFLQKKLEPSSTLGSFSAIIMEESERLNDIITDFLNFARPKEPKLGSCKLNSVIDKLISYQLDKKSYIIRNEVKEIIPSIHGDADMLYQAFLNLIINSMQAMPDGGTILIRNKSDEENIHLSFEDEGCGIPADIIDKVWDPFFTTKEKGTGLGLGIVKKIIEAHMGTISIKNLMDKGTVVSITFPIKKGV